MGLSNYPSPADGVLPLLVMHTVLSAVLLKNMVRSCLRLMGATWIDANLDLEEDPVENFAGERRRISITHFKSLCHKRSSTRGGGSSNCSGSGNSGLASVECCVCLGGFEANAEVSELACKHFFHKGCLEKWFNNKHSTCPLCRSIL